MKQTKNIIKNLSLRVAKTMDEWTVYRVVGEELDKLSEEY